MNMYNYEPSIATLVPSLHPLPEHREDTTQAHILAALVTRRSALDAALCQLAAHPAILLEAATVLVDTLRSGHKVLLAGNGGSAAEAQHFAAELVGRFKRDRAPYAVLSLTTDTSILTAIANDYGYHDVFARQVYAFGQPGDLLIAFSTSGESENLLRAACASRQCMMSCIAITGERASSLEASADKTIRVPAMDTAIIQELHMMVTHILCDIAETQLSRCEAEQSETEYALPDGEVQQ